MQIVIEISKEHYERIMRFEEGVTVYPTTLALYEAVKNGKPLPKDATNGDIIKTMFPNVEIEELIGSFEPVKHKLLGYRTWLGGRSQDYCLDWWNAPYKADKEG